MEQQLKQRLIGVTVIVSLIVIFVPLLFDKAEQPPDTAANGVPPIPDVFEEKTIDLPKTAEDVAPKESEAVSESGYRVIPLTDEIPKRELASPEPKPTPTTGGQGEPLEAPIEEEQFEPVPETAPALLAKPVPKAAKPGTAQVQPAKTEPKAPEPKKAKAPAAQQPAAKTKAAPAPAKTAESAAPTSKTPTAPAGTKSATSPPSQSAPAIVQPPKSALAEAPAKAAAKPAGETAAGSKASAAPSAVSAAWVVQTGSFTTESKARALAEKLRQAKFGAFVKEVSGQGGSIYRVQVGPELERARAEQMQKQIESTVGIKGIIVPHR